MLPGVECRVVTRSWGEIDPALPANCLSQHLIHPLVEARAWPPQSRHLIFISASNEVMKVPLGEYCLGIVEISRSR